MSADMLLIEVRRSVYGIHPGHSAWPSLRG